MERATPDQLRQRAKRQHKYLSECMKISPVTTTCIYCSSNYTPVALLLNSVIAMLFFALQSYFFIPKQNIIRLGVSEDQATSSEQRKVAR